MAKEAVSWVELHIEKFVLGVTGVFLLATIALYGVSTPNTKEVAGVKAGPARLDGVIVRGQARRLVESLHREPPTIAAVPDYADQWREVQDNVLAAAGVPERVRSPRPWGRLVPLLDSLRLPEREAAGLPKVLAPGKPDFASGRSAVYALEYAAGELAPLGVASTGRGGDKSLPPPELFEDISWITVGALVDVAAQRSAFFEAGYDARYSDMYVYDVQAQRQVRQPDGRWSEWQEITPYYPYLHWDVPQLRFQRSRRGDTLELPGRQAKALKQFKVFVEDYQFELRMPAFAKRRTGDKWRAPSLEGADWTEILKPYGLGAEIPDVFKSEEEKKRKEKEAELKPHQRIKKWLQEAKEVAENPGERTYEELRNTRSLLKKILSDPDARPFQKKRAQKLLDETIEPYYNEARSRRREEAYKRAIEEDEEAEGAELAETGPTQTAVWVHDVGLRWDTNEQTWKMTGVEPGRTYRYRLRLRLLNTLAGQLDRLASQEAAGQVLLVGDWSVPSDPITATKDKEFYVVAADAAGARAQVWVYVWKEGELLSKKFTVNVAQEIGDKQVRHKIKDKARLVDFSTGVTLVDIEPDRVYQRRKARREGFELDPVRTPAVILADASGALEERLVYLDKQAYTKLRKTLDEEKAGLEKKPSKEKPKKKKKGKKGGVGGGEM